MTKGTPGGIATALTFVIASVEGTGGNRITGAISPALIAFRVPAILGAIPSYLVGRDDAHSPASRPQRSKTIASKSESVAIGANNTGSISTNDAQAPAFSIRDK